LAVLTLASPAVRRLLIESSLPGMDNCVAECSLDELQLLAGERDRTHEKVKCGRDNRNRPCHAESLLLEWDG
jgi:hypothetical protein